VGEMLPLLCCYRVSFSDRVAKPEQKYLRRPGWSDQLTAGASWTTTFTDFVNVQYAEPLLAMAEFVGPGGERPYTSQVHGAVQNRQLGWHRRTRPGFRRGWVPA
jgi:hypothetical protein